MAILKIARMGHPVLLQRCAAVDDPGAPEIRRLVADMIETMQDAGGIGLAAPQVHVPLRLFVFCLPPERVARHRGTAGGDAPPEDPSGKTPDEVPDGALRDGGPVRVLVNPVIELLDEATALGWEGCLSIPGLRAAVPRHARIRYRAQDLDGRLFEAEADGLHAVVVQHEADHLDGVLYTMRMDDLRLLGFADELTRFAPAFAPLLAGAAATGPGAAPASAA